MDCITDIEKYGECSSARNIDHINQATDNEEGIVRVNEVLNEASGVDDIDPNDIHVIIDGVDYWIPNVRQDIKPVLNGCYSSAEDIKTMYFIYANAAGFDVRKATQRKVNGVVTLKYLLCNRHGTPNTVPVDTMDPENNKTKKRADTRRCDCMACIKYKIIPGSTNWILYEFEEKHNHELISRNNIMFSRGRRQLSNSQKHFITSLSSQNIGATVAHRLFSGIQGGPGVSGGLLNDFKNYSRDLKCFIGNSDAHMIVDKLSSRKKNVENFSFEFRVDNNTKQLNALFWDDETAKLNYKEFGDVVSFDATFRTNRYHMVFVPFTGIDNHKKSVTFGAGLLSREDIDSYTWLLRSFLKAFDEKQPILVLSDQDPAMKNAILRVFPRSHHRLCMWHITSKLPVKISTDVLSNTDFRKKFNFLIWNSKLEEKDFEDGWCSLMSEYNLTDNKWLKDMYALRKLWIPAFFKRVQFSGLMRTTSRSESQNSAFHQNTNYGSTLVQFMMSFEAAMEKQRFTHSSLDFQSADFNPKMLTQLPIERSASHFYTRKIFRQVQKEIYLSIYACSQFSHTKGDIVDTALVKEFRQEGPLYAKEPKNVDVDSDDDDEEFEQIKVEASYEITYNKTENTFECSCLKFVQYGFLCRHIFTTMKVYNINDIPPNHLLRRWKNGVIPTEMLKRCFRYSKSNENIERSDIGIFTSVDKVVSTLENDEHNIENYFKDMQQLETKYLSLVSSKQQTSKHAEFEKTLGVNIPSVVEIENPAGIRNKGCGPRKRLKAAIEVAQEHPRKNTRCQYCLTSSNHDWRNCPKRKEDVKNGKIIEHPLKKNK